MKYLNTRAELIIQQLYKAMYDPKYKIEEGTYAKIDNNPLPIMEYKTEI